ncbi:MAG: helix-turn-helix domain-containing protein [Clostridiales bacterium]|nr:helix-turn-helix domain-containing protein [Clostridiales bacterium]
MIETGSSRQKLISKLISARLEKGFTQEQLAQRIGTQRSNISRIESGAQNLSIDMLTKICDALDMDFDFTLEERSNSLNNTYELRIYDKTLVTFELKEDGLEGLNASVLSVDDSLKPLFPVDLKLDSDGVVKWLKRRVIPKNRAFVGEILKSLGLGINDTKGIIDVCKGLSLNDSYWVVPQGFTGKFGQYNLYENRFSEVLALVAYTGAGGSDKAFTTSPELTTGGALPKAWRYIEGDGIYLYKGGTDGAANTGKEPYSEFYACQVAEAMGLDCVSYDLENWKGILASKCKLFTDIDTAYIPAYQVTDSNLRACLDYYKSISQDVYETLCSMLVFDAVIYNEDRHFGNFGVLRDNHTGKIIGPAPVFDNGLSLFSMAMPDDFKNIGEYAKTRTTPYGVSFESVVSEVMGRKQLAQLRHLIGFKFERHPSINLPEERLQAIEKHIEERTRELLSLPRKRMVTKKRGADAR